MHSFPRFAFATLLSAAVVMPAVAQIGTGPQPGSPAAVSGGTAPAVTRPVGEAPKAASAATPAKPAATVRTGAAPKAPTPHAATKPMSATATTSTPAAVSTPAAPAVKSN